MMGKIVFVDIDTQFDFIRRKGKLYVKGAEKIIPNLKRLTEFAKKNKITIISSVDAHSLRDKEFKLFPTHCVKGRSGQRKIKETLVKNRVSINFRKLTNKKLRNILDKYNQIILEKKTFDVFSNPNSKNLFQDIKVAFVYGVATDYCVKAACLGLLKLKKKVNLIIDAIKPVSAQEGKRTLCFFKSKGVKLIKSKDLINSIIFCQ